MNATRREWMSKLNKPMTGAVPGKVIARGMMEDSSGAFDKPQTRDVLVCAPEEGQVPCGSPLMRIDIRKLDFSGTEIGGVDLPPQVHVRICTSTLRLLLSPCDAIDPSNDGSPTPVLEESSVISHLVEHLGFERVHSKLTIISSLQTESVGPPLARPSFSPFETGVVALGTEQHPYQAADQPHSILVAKVNRSSETTVKLLCPAFTLEQPVCAMDWLNDKDLLVATGPHMVVFGVGNEVLRKRAQMPPMHEDDIRDMQVCASWPVLVLFQATLRRLRQRAIMPQRNRVLQSMSNGHGHGHGHG
jgi:hypothetical protein